MTEGNNTRRIIHENLDTSYTNLAALVRYLQNRDFVGTVHIVLDEYEADLIINARKSPMVKEFDHAKNIRSEGEEALQRVLVRASEAGGLITVYEDHPSVRATDAHLNPATPVANAAHASEKTAASTDESPSLHELSAVIGGLIAAVERAAAAMPEAFEQAMSRARIELADDYAFFDPTASNFTYSNGQAHIHTNATPVVIVSGVSALLRSVVNAISSGPRERTIRERIALELALLARRRQGALEKFNILKQLDRIAGTRVL